MCCRPVIKDLFLPEHISTTTAFAADKSEDQASPNISGLAFHLQQEWDHAANAHLGSIIMAPQSNTKVWWSSGLCKTGQPHRWQATVSERTNGNSCPYDSGQAVCPCNNLAGSDPVVAAEWDGEANGDWSPETAAASSLFKAAWRCGLCGHRWSATVLSRAGEGTGCPQCWRGADRNETQQPSISDGAPYLLAEWDWEANAKCGWHPDKVTVDSHEKVYWVMPGLVNRWQASPAERLRP